MKKIITFLLSLIIAYSPIYAFAGAAEQWNGSPRQMTIADQGMRTRNGIGVGNVKAANGMINADITQRVTVDGSNATINTKVSIPANDDSFKRNTAKHAKNLLKGGAVAVGAAVAMGVILDGVGWVIDEGGKVTKKESIDPFIKYVAGGLPGSFHSAADACAYVLSATSYTTCNPVLLYKEKGSI